MLLASVVPYDIMLSHPDQLSVQQVVIQLDGTAPVLHKLQE